MGAKKQTKKIINNIKKYILEREADIKNLEKMLEEDIAFEKKIAYIEYWTTESMTTKFQKIIYSRIAHIQEEIREIKQINKKNLF